MCQSRILGMNQAIPASQTPFLLLVWYPLSKWRQAAWVEGSEEHRSPGLLASAEQPGQVELEALKSGMRRSEAEANPALGH